MLVDSVSYSLFYVYRWKRERVVEAYKAPDPSPSRDRLPNMSRHWQFFLSVVGDDRRMKEGHMGGNITRTPLKTNRKRIAENTISS